MLLIALLVVITSPGKAIFAHRRVGTNGKPFYCYKFRTMAESSDLKLQCLLKSDPKLQAEWDSTYKLENDPRVTKVGRFLRKTLLDELPQFWNVLKGEMSVCGPRPVTGEEVEKKMGLFSKKILSVRPGISGLWQTREISTSDYDFRLEMDLNYIKNQSFLLDLKIIMKTVKQLFKALFSLFFFKK